MSNDNSGHIFQYGTVDPLMLDTKKDLTDATNTKILYKKPDGTTGEWNASKSGTFLEYTVTEGDADQQGEWQVQTYIEIDSKPFYGDIITLVFQKPLKRVE